MLESGLQVAACLAHVINLSDGGAVGKPDGN